MSRLINADNLNLEGQHYNKSQMKAILDFIDNQPTANQWIDVNDRLPENAKEVLVQLDWEDMNVVMGYYWNNKWHVEMVAKEYEVLYWMPLPEPIKKEGAADE